MGFGHGVIGGLIGGLVDVAMEVKRYSVLDLKNGNIMRIDDNLLNTIFAKNMDLHPGQEYVSDDFPYIIAIFQKLNDRLKNNK